MDKHMQEYFISLLKKELIAAAVTAGLHLWRRSTLLSILGGTVCYMALIQTVFA